MEDEKWCGQGREFGWGEASRVKSSMRQSMIRVLSAHRQVPAWGNSPNLLIAANPPMRKPRASKRRTLVRLRDNQRTVGKCRT